MGCFLAYLSLSQDGVDMSRLPSGNQTWQWTIPQFVAGFPIFSHYHKFPIIVQIHMYAIKSHQLYLMFPIYNQTKEKNITPPTCQPHVGSPSARLLRFSMLGDQNRTARLVRDILFRAYSPEGFAGDEAGKLTVCY